MPGDSMYPNSSVRPTREQAAAEEASRYRDRHAAERRLQLLGLLALAAAVLGGTVLYVGPRNVFLPGWWHLW